jgi:branched-chain amino acid transport system permease protein
VVVSGLATGAIWALCAIGFALLWQTSQTINFAQGEFVMLPGFLILAGLHLGLPMWASFLFALVLAILLFGVAFKQILVDPMIRHGVLPLVVATIGLALFLKDGAKLIWGAEALRFPDPLPTDVWHVAGVVISAHDVVVLLVAFVLILALQFFLSGTVTGRSMQAVAQNPDVARILGIPVERMILFTFAINAVLVTVAALLVTPVYLAKFENGESIGLFAFIAAIVGGFNQVRGAILGGLIVGVVDNLSAAYLSNEYRGALPMVLLIVVILFRPQGLLGRAEERTV